MIFVIAKTALVTLAGIYAKRASNIVFHPIMVTLLWFVTLFAFVMSLVLFYRPPTVQGWWQYTVIGLCLVGVAANAIRFWPRTLNTVTRQTWFSEQPALSGGESFACHLS
jgi:uncharacterized membrane protein